MCTSVASSYKWHSKFKNSNDPANLTLMPPQGQMDFTVSGCFFSEQAFQTKFDGLQTKTRNLIVQPS